MHRHCEVIMPPSSDIGKDLEKIMSPFYENRDDCDGNEFWDFYVMGGRFAGIKETCGYNQERLDEFYKKLNENKITVSGVICGKQQINPATQIPMVDKLWNDVFPTENGEIVACPLFAHSNNQYDSNDLISCDICRVEEIPENLIASRVIIACPSYDGNEIEAKFMICDSQWNGINFMNVDWDGKVKSAIEKFLDKCDCYREDYKQKVLPKPNWICITVDYHS